MAEWEERVGCRFARRERKPSSRIQAIGTDADHHTAGQARLSPHTKEWAAAQRKERAQLEKYGVFTRVKKADISEGINSGDTKWVYIVKRKTDGSIEKYKACKVGRGFTQINGISYDSE